MDVQTYFFRRTNMNALGKPRSWTDHLLWHHACHTVDLFQYQTGETAIVGAARCRARSIPSSKIAMDMSIELKVPSGAICTLSLSFNNDGPARHVLPLHLRQRHLHRALRRSGRRQRTSQIDVSKVDVSMNGIELQDREFFAAIKEKREPNASVAQVLPAMRTLDRLEKAALSS